MMISQIARTALALALFAGSGTAFAAPANHDGYVHLGVARINLVDKGTTFADGVAIPGADYNTKARLVVGAELGYFITSDVAVSVAGTTPGTTKNFAAGSLAGLGNLGSDTFSIFTGTVHYHFNRGGRIQPYVGGGFAYQKTWDTDDGVVSNLDISDGNGPVVQGGIDFDLSDRFGIYVDAKKAWIKNDARGMLGPSVITARPKLDPLILQAGISFHF